MTSNDSSAVDDSAEALNEARDLILGDMAERILDDVNGRMFPGLKQWYHHCYSDKLPRVDYHEDKIRSLWPDDTSPFLRPPFVNMLKEWVDGMEQINKEGHWHRDNQRKWYGRDLEPLEEMDFQGKPDFVLLCPDFFEKNQDTKASDRFWQNAISLGTVREVTPSGYTQAFLQVCHQAQQLFHHQPDRLWVDSFLVYGFALEFIIFDRSGVYTSESFDLRSKDIPDGVRGPADTSGGGLQYPVVASLMSAMGFLQGATDSRLGINNMIEHDGEMGTFGSCQHVYADGEEEAETVAKFTLHGEPIARPIARITDAGALCYRAKRPDREGDIALKISWEDGTKRRETDMLQTAIERGVWGVPELIHKEDIASIARLHSFTFKVRDLQAEPGTGVRSFPDSVSKRRVSSLSEEMINGAQRDQMKREAAKEQPGRHQLSTATEASPPHLMLKDPHAIVITAVATAPFGRPLSKFQNPKELLLALKDGIKAHRSLYEKGNILHQDISVNNVIIPEVVSEDAPHGILIDFDEARDLRDTTDPADKCPDREHQAVEICGTRAFLSIDLMLGRHTHSADHDLESFFYTLLWLCVCHHSPAPPMTSRLNIWQEKEEYPELAKKKAVTVLDDKGWEGLLNEFTPSLEKLKPLARELRSLIFPGGRVGGGRIGDDLTSLYDGFTGAFDRALAELSDD